MDKQNSTFFLFIFMGLVLLGFGITESIKNTNKNKVEEKIEKSKEDEEQKKIEEAQKVKADIEKKQIEQKPYKTPPPEINVKAFGIYNITDDTYMFSKSADSKLPPASLTKIMTAILAIEKYDLSKTVVIPERCTKLDATKVGFLANDVVNLEALLYGLLVKSGADSACAIANIDNEADFINKMNAKSKEIGLENTTFNNEVGFDAENDQLSSVNDLIKLSRYALKSSIFRKIVGTQNIVIKSLSANSKVEYSITNTNDLLFSIPGTVGIKTGYTDNARGCLSFLHENQGQEILIVMLGSEDRFKDTKTILDWATEQIRLLKEDSKSFGG